MESNATPNKDSGKTEKCDGYLDIKVPSSSRGRRTLKVWRRRWIEVRKCSEKVTLHAYISDSAVSTQEPPLYKKDINPKQAIIYRSQSKTHNYAFTIAEGKEMLVHLSASSESESQGWMESIRKMLWSPSEVLLLEKVFSDVHEVSVIDNEFTHRAGLLGAYGYLKITDKKLILFNPHTEHVIQEWYLNSLCRFQLLPARHKEDKNRLFSIETGSDSSTGKGVMYLYSKGALEIMQSIGSAIQKILERRKNQAKTKAEIQQCHKDLEELELCLKLPEENNVAEEHYQVPRREIRSVLDIPNFTFDKPLGHCNPELKLRRKEKIVGERRSCPEMDCHMATKLDRLSLSITDLPVPTEASSSQTADRNLAEDHGHKICEGNQSNGSRELEDKTISAKETDPSAMQLLAENTPQTQLSNDSQTSLTEENLSLFSERQTSNENKK